MKKLAVSILFVTFLGMSYAGVLIQKLTFDPVSISITKDNGFDRIGMGNIPVMMDKEGTPALPEEGFHVVIPCNATVTNFEIVSKDESALPGIYHVFPVQTPRTYSPYEKEYPFVYPNPAIYNSSEIFPKNVVEYAGTGTKGGFRIASFRVYPVRFVPLEKKLLCSKELVLKIHYQEGVVQPTRRSERQIAVIKSDLYTMVANTDDINRFAPQPRNESFGSPYLPPGDYEHVIITPATFKDTLQKLADWRTKKGTPSKVVHVESLNVYPGRDLAEKMRNFMKDADTTWHTSFFFIARQDYPALQYRNLYISASYTFPGDMYFSCLDGTYNDDNDGYWGEWPSDNPDFLSDVYVGMITLDPTNGRTEASRYLSKLLRYEKSPDTTYFPKALIFWNAGPSGYPDSIYNVIPKPPWTGARVYSGAATAQALTDSLNRGYGYFSAQTHGMVDAICTSPYWTSPMAIALTNTNKLNVCITVCCDVGAWDRSGTNGDCIAENMCVHAPNGFVAQCMNARSGWMNVAELFNYMFFWKFLPKDGTRRCSAYVYVGQALARTKDQFRANYASSSYYWRMEAYERNLFGDPAIPLHNTGPVRNLTVNHPTSIRIGSQNFTVSVNVNDFAPIDSVLVCLWKGTEVYARGYTNASGSVTLPINPTTAGQMSVTCSKRNYLPYEGTASVTSFVAEENAPVVPAYFALGRSEPNPFGRITTISYQLPKPVHSRLVIYDASGRLIRTLVDRNDKAGWYTVNWDGKNNAGVECAAGIYFYRLEAGSFTATKNLVLVR